MILLISLQFFSLNIPATLPIKEAETLHAPKKILNILQRSCYDCHSSKVKAPWYYNIAPVSWYTQLHVKNARQIMNFSKWNSYDKRKQLKFLEKLPKAIVIRMPMISYLYLHEEVRLTKDEKKLLNSWSKKLKEKVK